MDTLAFLIERRQEILEAVRESLGMASRSEGDVRVVAVSKTADVERFLLACEAGWDAFAENRPQELVRKTAALGSFPPEARPTMDMIGNLQTNKINQILGRVRLIHSISSAHLAEAVSKRAEPRGMVQDVLLEVNVSGEASKSGFSPDELRKELENVLVLPGIRVSGLMTMAPAGDRSVARRTFAALREYRDELEARAGCPLPELSCGMSADFREALLEGSTIVRLGRVVFSPEHPLIPAK
ncbi:MAG: YggS family pyridoxal phosphate-dependent enzyme [Atopobiaceae bacterium]|nr:YggS family pyridoxal phosphate-dependent enzyme [Atopobiaceae bacterium]